MSVTDLRLFSKPKERAVIRLTASGRPFNIDEAERILLQDTSLSNLYRYGDTLVHVSNWSKEEQKYSKRVHRSVGAPILRVPTPALLDDIFGRLIKFERYDERKNEFRKCDCPDKFSKQYLERGNWRLPKLIGIVSGACVRPDGSILTEQGYDEATGLLLCSDIHWKAPTDLSHEAAISAAAKLWEPFKEFKFCTEAGKSVVLSMILTGIQRRLLDTAPLHAIDANIQGAGKTLIGDCSSIIATGNEVSAVALGKGDETELAKLLLSVLMSGDQIVLIDNVTRPLDSDTLAAILTRTSFKGRILGVSRTIDVPTNTLFTVTGNNLEFRKDMPRRSLCGRIEVDDEQPDQRTFNITNLKQYCRENRQILFNYGLTILAAYAAAGRPGRLPPYGSFEQWSDQIRSAIVWAGFDDPCKTRVEITASDPEREATRFLFVQWYEQFQNTERSAREVIDKANEREPVDKEFRLDSESPKYRWTNPELRSALLGVAHAGTDKLDGERLGYWCRSHKGRTIIADGFKYQLVRSKGHGREGVKWQIVRTPLTSDAVREAEIERHARADAAENEDESF